MLPILALATLFIVPGRSTREVASRIDCSERQTLAILRSLRRAGLAEEGCRRVAVDRAGGARVWLGAARAGRLASRVVRGGGLEGLSLPAGLPRDRPVNPREPEGAAGIGC